MNSKFLGSLLSLICTLIFGLMALSHNTSRIPVGDEMGAILEFFIALFCAVAIYGITVIFSITIWKLGLEKGNILQAVLFLVSVSLIYYSTWRICVYRKPPLTFQVEKDLEIKDTKAGYEYFRQIPELIHDGYRYNVPKNIRNNDSLFILKSLRSLINEPLDLTDSLSKVRIRNFFGYFIDHVQDTLEVSKYFQQISRSLKVRDIFYSPKSDVLLTFISYNTTFTDIDKRIVPSAQSIALIGYKTNNRMVFYNYFRPDSYIKYIVNDDLAYSFCFKNAIGDGYNPGVDRNFLKEAFWSRKEIVKNVSFKGQKYYGFEVYTPSDQNEIRLIEPVLVLPLNEVSQIR